MTLFKKAGVVLLGATLTVLAVDVGGRLAIPGVGSFISTAEAVVGRPLTPVSVAGATRRTVRRCAAGVYNC
jgi:hypothetical protein